MAASPLIKRLSASVPALNNATPFIKEMHIQLFSSAGANLYGVDSPAPSNAAAYQAFKQTISGNKAFVLNSTMATAQNTTGGALSALNQLRVVGFIGSTPKARARGDQVAPASSFIVGAGGGTLAGDATVSIKGTTAANLLAGSVLLSIASSGANTKTILPGDTFVVAGDTTVYYATGGGTLTMNGTTEINVGITPPIQVTQTAALAVTIAAADGKTMLFADAAAVGDTVTIWVNAAADIETMTGGALTASRPYDNEIREVMFADAAVDLIKLG